MAHPAAMNPLGYISKRQCDGDVQIKNKLFSERLAKARNLYRKDLYAHFGCVNAIDFSNEGELLVSGGDDRRVLLWSVPAAMFDTAYPNAMHTFHTSNIFCVAFDSRNSRIFSGGNDDQVIIHDTQTSNLVSKIIHRKPVYGLSINPQNDDILATAGDDGRILIFDVRESSGVEAQCLARQKTGFHSVAFNPTNPRYLATANSEEGIALWDIRKPKDELIHYDANGGKISGITACFDQTGKRLLALRRRLPPVLYATEEENAVCQFYHPQYYNSCTMKTCCFAGENDEYVLSGSDDFNLYMWQVPEDDGEWGTSHVVLKGHRSIVNQVRYNRHNNIIATSGVEKMVKFWTTLPVGTWKGSMLKEHKEPPRPVYTREDYIEIVGNSGERISHDYSDQSTLEDTKMMAFFDSLIQREIEGWDSPSDSISTDSDSDGQSRYWTNLVSEIFHSRKNGDDLKKQHKTNTIAHLIYKKRNYLAKMAHDKSKSALRRYHLKEKSRKRKISPKEKTTRHNKNGKKCSSDRETKKLRKYRTRQSVKDMWECNNSNNSYDAPSTSTGITNSNSSNYRVYEQDSEEEGPPVHNSEDPNINENFISILPTPLNGTHDMFLGVLESNTSNNNGNVVTVRNEPFNHASTSNGHNVPTSNSFLRNNNCIVTTYHSDTDTDSDLDYRYLTPVKKLRRMMSASDSGCGTGPCSSNSSKKNINHQECSPSSSEDEHLERFKARVRNVMANLGKALGHDSDSNSNF